MPVFCYSTEDGSETIEEVFRCGKAPASVTRNGRKYMRDIGAEHGSFRNTPGAWPKWTIMSGVHPSQRQELAQFLEKSGVPTQVNAQGEMKWESRGHRSKVLRALGYFDKNAGYSDPTPTYK